MKRALSAVLLPLLLPALAASSGAGKARANARVIVRLAAAAAAFRPEGELAGAVAVTTQRAAIARARGSLVAELPEGSYSITRAFESIPYVAMELSPEGLDALESADAGAAVGGAGAVAVSEDRLMRPSLASSVPLVGGDTAWAEGFTGSGWSVAILDTGVDRAHPFLRGKVVSEACYSASGSCPNHAPSQIGSGAGQPCGWAPSSCAHGTHVAGIAAGSGPGFSGVARGARVIAVQVFSRFSGAVCAGSGEDPCALAWTSDIIAGLERVYALRSTLAIAAVNLSLGGGKYTDQAACDADDTALKAAIDTLRSAGIATVAAAGNDGWADALNSPACLTSAVSVAATSKSDVVAGFSNSAPFLSLMSPGLSITSSVPGGGFSSWSGTSMAAPHVTGAWALARQAMSAASVTEVLEALERTGTPVIDGRNGLTKPRINVDRILLSCSASADPDEGAAPVAAVLEAAASRGAEPYTYAWDFGDGSTPEAGPTLGHTFTTPGDYDATVTVQDAAGLTCACHVTVTAAGPRITRVRRVSNPFRLIVEGIGFAPGDIVRIDGAAAPATVFGSATRLVAGRGAPLRAMIPSRAAVAVTVAGPDGVVSAPCPFGR